MPRDGSEIVEFEAPPAWMDEANDALYAEEPKEPLPPLTLIDPSSWAQTDTPERAWKVKDYIPDRQATLLTGKGAAGKSLVSQQLCTCLALGLPFLGLDTVETKALYITCEDDADELHRRQKAITASLGHSVDDLSGKLFLLSLQGEMNNELAVFDREGRMSIAPRYEQIVAACEASGARFVVLDNTAHTFTGNENDRHQVAAFINLCNRLAIAIEGAVVIVGHPNKAGDSYSGSTAWENQVRSRLFMEIPVNDDGVPSDPDMRVMRREKTNYAQRGGDLNFMWYKGAFVLPEQVPETARDDTAGTARAAHENELFLTCLAKATATKRATSHVNGINYAPRIFAHMTEGKGTKEEAFRGAMERLISLGKIELDVPLWRGGNRVMKTGIRAVNDCTDPARTPSAPTPPTNCTNPHEPPSQVVENIAPTPARTRTNPSARTPVHKPCTDPHEPPSQVIDFIAPTLHASTPPYSTNMEGEPLGGLSPSEPDEGWKSNPLLNGKAAPESMLPMWLDDAPPIDETDPFLSFDDGEEF